MFDQYREIRLVDFEFMYPPGERPLPLCLVGREFQSGELLRVWFDDPTGPPQCPIDSRVGIANAATITGRRVGADSSTAGALSGS